MTIFIIYVSISCGLVLLNVVAKVYLKDEELFEWLDDVKEYSKNGFQAAGILLIVIIIAIVITIPLSITEIIQIFKKGS